MSSFNPLNWYWIVGGDATKVYSSAAGDYVTPADATYQAWLAGGDVPTKIDTEANLGDVLAQYSNRPVAAGVLDGYRSSQANTVLTHKLFKIAFNHENRLRTVERALSLNGSPANITPAQAFAFVKGLM